MTVKKEKRSFSNFGFSTILLAFVMICVAVFSVLSFMTAYSDFKLSKKVADRTSLYYKAEEKAYEKLYEIDNILLNTYENSNNVEEYYANIKASLSKYGIIDQKDTYYVLTFEENISDNQSLVVKLTLKYPQTLGDSFFEISEWKSVYDTVIPEEDTLNLIQ